MTRQRKSRNRIGLVAVAVICSLAVPASVTSIVSAGEIVPALGYAKSAEGTGDGHLFASLAARGNVAPPLVAEVGIGYRSESSSDDLVHAKVWPITASLYLTPLPFLYAGGGVGWYQTSYDFAAALPLRDETRRDFGTHLGGGVQMPLGSRAGLDLNGRYVMMQDQSDPVIPEKYRPDFWTGTVGLALKF